MKSQMQIFNYSVQNSIDTILDVYIDGAIVDAETLQMYQDFWGDTTSVSFKSVRDQVLQSGKKTINFWVNSYGGHVGDAMAIHDWIVNLESAGYNITTKGLGMICSAATYILSASKNSTISKNSYYMIHNVSGGVYGNVNEIENYATSMRKFNDAIVDYYTSLTGKDTETVTNWMNAETWFTGTEAVENGFVKNLIENQNFKNNISADIFPYKNTSAMNVYNSFVKKDNENNFNPENLDMNKFVEAIVNAFKLQNLVVTSEEVPASQLTEASLTNALTEAFKDFKPEPNEEQISNSITNFFKDGLPENVANQIATAITEATKDFATNQKIADLEAELELVKSDLLNAGGAKPSNTNRETDKNNHVGISWGSDNN
jgi:ATP-dependent protease ClpP protease subunit